MSAIMEGITLLATLRGALVTVVLPNGRWAQTREAKLNRTVLPIPEPNYPRSTVLDARDAKPPPRFEVKAHAGGAQRLIVLVDEPFGLSVRE